MLEHDLLELVKKIQRIQAELPDVEVKSAKQGCPKVFDSLSSLANLSGGGTILFGMDERDDFRICGVYDANDLMTQITNQCQQMTPVLRPLYTVAACESGTIVSAEIQEVGFDQKPCFYAGKGRPKGSYVRVGDQDLPMTEYEVYSYEAFRRQLQDELRACPRAELCVFDREKLNEYFVAVRKKKRQLANLSEEEILRFQGLIQMDNSPTLAGNLLLGRYPQASLPQLCIVAVAIQGTQMGDVSQNGERFIDNERIEGTLPEMLDGALAFVERNTPVATLFDEQTGKRSDRPMYPPIAVRELVLNALVHRDYSIHTESSPIALRLFQNRLEIENPGGLYGRMTLDQLGHVSADTRNPFIAMGMEALSSAENRFSGIPTVRRLMAEAQLPPPQFESLRGVFTAVLVNQQQERPFPQNADAMTERILAFCRTPRSRKELETEFSEMTIVYLMSHKIKPLLDAGRLAQTLPDRPKSKYQRYYTVKQ